MTSLSRLESDEFGVGMVEIVVSMLVLAVLAMSFLPLLIQGIKVSASNATLVTATRIVHDEMEQVRTLTTCASVTPTPTPSPTVTDPRGVQLAVKRTVGPCPVSFPGTRKVTVEVSRGIPPKVLASATTLVFVES
ncbi:MAG: hypothetical protein JWP30_1057 [Homoserinimonas sp.]|jgi:type II secretory pathway pseudopilin PulG|nr:hypothetical protein [Homoserinimonas sp.]